MATTVRDVNVIRATPALDAVYIPLNIPPYICRKSVTISSLYHPSLLDQKIQF